MTATTNGTTESSTPAASPTRVPIPRMEGFDPERFSREHDQPRKPVVITGAVGGWPALAEWSPEHFARRFGDLPVRPSVGLPDTEVPYRFRDVDHRREMTLADFVQRLGTGERCYLDQADVTRFPGLEEQFDFSLLGARDVRVISLWLGSGTRSGLHYDYLDNFFAQVYGEKRALLASPESARLVYPFGDNVTKSQVAPEHPDLERHSRFARAILHEATLGPGDVLFIPQGWWHYFTSPAASISLACWYGNPLTPGHDARVMMGASAGAWLRLARDFVWHGLLHRPYETRLYSLPPTGKMIYDLLAGMVPWGRKRPAAG